MTLQIVTVPCLKDNYAYLIHDAGSGETALVDVPEAAPILAALKDHGWGLDWVLITHHHDDHVQGLREIVRAHRPQVIGGANDAYRLPPLDHQVLDGDTFTICGQEVEVMDVSGHTVGHLAYYMPGADAVFTADSLMALGCGRVFEGTFPQMWASLSKLAALPKDTMVYSGHEYTAANGRFALTVEPDNPDLLARVAEVAAARAENRPTVPSSLAAELATNPFLRSSVPELKAALGMAQAPDEEVFAEIRTRKDDF